MGSGKELGGLVLVLWSVAGVASAADVATEIVPRPVERSMSLPVAPYPGNRDAQAVKQVAAVIQPSSGARSTPAPVQQWEVKASDITLARTIERWAASAGYKVKWDASRNFLIGASDVYTGSFESALQTVLASAGIRLSDYPLEACIYANTPPLVRITRQGEQSRECIAATE